MISIFSAFCWTIGMLLNNIFHTIYRYHGNYIISTILQLFIRCSFIYGRISEYLSIGLAFHALVYKTKRIAIFLSCATRNHSDVILWFTAVSFCFFFRTIWNYEILFKWKWLNRRRQLYYWRSVLLHIIV